MSKLEKKHKHIITKDKGDDISKILGDMIQDSRQKMVNLTYDKLLTNLNASGPVWYRSQMSSLNDFKLKLKNLSDTERKRILKATKGGTKQLNLNSKQNSKINREIKKGMNNLTNAVYKNYVSNIAQIHTTTKLLRNNVTDGLYKTIREKIEQNQNYGIVSYKNGRKIRWENYMEMKVRTEIQKDITDNMIQEGHSNGVVFYIAAYFGDCAIDHVDYQGKIYYDANWETNAPKDRIEEIKNYIYSNKLISIQEVKGAPAWFCTRPNCRHYFQLISIDEVLGIKTEKQLNDKRTEFGLNFNGKYKPEKYNALNEQRYNERGIRAWKGKLEVDQKIYDNMPATITEQEKLSLMSKIAFDKRKIREWQVKQRILIKNNPGVLHRNYNREIYNNMISDFGIGKEIKHKKINANYNLGKIQFDYTKLVGKYNEKIVLTKERENHIETRHPEMKDYVSKLFNYINNPSKVEDDKNYKDTKNIKYYLDNKHEIVITIKFAKKDSNKFSSIISARYQRRRK